MLQKLIKYKYVSFDIFDTLIKRDVLNPSDIFNIVEEEYNKNNKEKIFNFKLNRLNAEHEARQISSKEEISIDDIYEALIKIYGKDASNQLKELEEYVEISVSVPNDEIISIYNELLNHNIKIILTSDMYLDKNTIKLILDKCSIKKYHKLYLSSVVGKTKRRGSLYPYILRDLNISPNKIIHLGDNKISDYLIPRIYKIKSLLIKKNINYIHYNKKMKNISYKRLSKFISNHKKEDYYYNFGYSLLGPLVYAFTKYIIKNTKNDENLFFLSRDGYIINKVYNILNEEKNNNYLYVSRRSLIVPLLYKEKDIMSMIQKYNGSKYESIKTYLERLGIEEKLYLKRAEEYNINIKKYISVDKIKNDKKIYNFFNSFLEEIKSNSKKEYQNVTRYLKENKFNKNSVIVDIGWHGNMQKALCDLIDSNDIEGYYIGIMPYGYKNVKLNGYLFQKTANKDYIALKQSVEFFESLFLENRGSTKKYEEENKKMVPEFYKVSRSTEIQKIYEKIWEGVYSFAEEFDNSIIKEYIEFDGDIEFESLSHFLYYPNKNDVKKFKFIFKKNKNLYTSGWMSGYIKNKFYINFFSNIYKALYPMIIRKK